MCLSKVVTSIRVHLSGLCMLVQVSPFSIDRLAIKIAPFRHSATMYNANKKKGLAEPPGPTQMQLFIKPQWWSMFRLQLLHLEQ